MSEPASVGRSSGERLPHLAAYNALVGTKAEIEEVLALGLYMRSECLWAQGLPKPPSPSDHRTYHKIASVEHKLQETQDTAGRMLDDYLNEIIQKDRVQVLSNAYAAAQEAAEKTPWSWGKGVIEAVLGAAAYTIILIVAAFLLHWGGVDLDEIFKHIAGHG